MQRLAGFVGLVGALLVAQAAAAAHMPYLKPTTFGPKRDFVTLESGMAADHFFAMDFPIRGAGEVWATGRSGTPVKAVQQTSHKEFAVVEVALPDPGTYRISTGDRPGRSAKWARIDGAWITVRPAGAPAAGGGKNPTIDEAALPAGAETMVAQAYVRAETYVTKGAPDRGALKPTGQGVEAELITHPNEVFAGEPFKLRLLSDGKPLADVAYAIYRGGDLYEEKRYTHSARTDAAGAVTATFDRAGVYVLVATYPGRVEGAAFAPVGKTTTYSLTFEVTR